MREKTLLKVSLAGSLIGILLLFAISGRLNVDEGVISNIDETDIGGEIRIKGVIVDVKKTGSIMLIDIAQLEKMDVVVFSNDFVLNKGDYVEITGKIEEYNGEMELIADKIVLK